MKFPSTLQELSSDSYQLQHAGSLLMGYITLMYK